MVLLAVLLLPSLAAAQWSGQWGTATETTGGRMAQQQLGLAREFTLQVTNAQFDILRNEAYQRGVARIGGTFTYDFAQFVPTDFATSPLFMETAQFLPDGQWNSAQAGFGPVLAVGIRHGRWELHHSHQRGGREVPGSVNLGPVDRNRWVPFRVEVRWSPGSDGWVRIYKDGALVLQRTGPTTFTHQVPYFRTGLYTRRHWTHRDSNAPLHQFRILHAALTVRQGAGGSVVPVEPPAVRPDPSTDPATEPEPTMPGGEDQDPGPVLPPTPVIPPVVLPEPPSLPILPPPRRPPPVVVRAPRAPPPYAAGAGDG